MKDYTTQSFFIKKITFKNYYLRLSLFVLQKYSITTIFPGVVNVQNKPLNKLQSMSNVRELKMGFFIETRRKFNIRKESGKKISEFIRLPP